MADAAIGWDNPCERAAALSKAYYEMLAGKQAISISFSDRSVSYNSGDVTLLEQEMRRAQAECQALSTGKPTRMAMTAGTRFSYPGRGY